MITDPEEALTHIQRVAAEGRLEWAPTDQVTSLDAEIQEIFSEVYGALMGRLVKKGGIMATDRSYIGDVLDFEGDEYTAKSEAALKTASDKLGIPLSADNLFVTAALLLRAKRATSHS